MFGSTTVNHLLAALPAVEVNTLWWGRIDVAPALLALAIFVGLSLFFWLVKSILLIRLRSLSMRTQSDIDDVIIDTLTAVRPFVYTLFSLYVALQVFTMPNWLWTALTALIMGLLVWQAIEVLLQFVRYGTRRMVEKDADGDGEVDPNAATASDLINLMARIVLYVFGVIFVLSNLGIEVTSLIAGLGIGGIAVAFALQGVLSDLFASFSIYLDRPFRVGDFIVLGTDSGTVEKIGVKTTRIRTLQGEELVVSNAELTTARVQNFKKMQKRRIVTTFGIAYETAPDSVAAVPGIVEDIFSSIEHAKLDRVHFTTFGDSALLFEVVYFIDSSNYTVYLDSQQAFNLELLRLFNERGIAFAYPTQTIYHKAV